jgi:hypothetical protein
LITFAGAFVGIHWVWFASIANTAPIAIIRVRFASVTFAGAFVRIHWVWFAPIANAAAIAIRWLSVR